MIVKGNKLVVENKFDDLWLVDEDVKNLKINSVY